jgi:hypothetical protein
MFWWSIDEVQKLAREEGISEADLNEAEERIARRCIWILERRKEQRASAKPSLAVVCPPARVHPERQLSLSLKPCLRCRG